MAKKVKKERSKVRKIIEGIFVGIFVALVGVSCFAMISSTVAKKEGGNEYAPTSVGNIYMPIIVLTDSMEPDIKTDSAIFLKKITPEEVVEKYNNNEKVDLCFDDYFAVYQNITSAYTETTINFLANYSVNGVGQPKTDRTTESTPAPIRTLTHRLFYIQINNDTPLGEGKYFFFVEGINTESTHYSATNQYQVFTESELYGLVTGSSVFIGGVFSFVKSPLGLIILLLIPTLYMVISSVLDLFKAYEPEPEGTSPDGLKGLSKKDIKRLKEEMLNQIINKDSEKKEEESKWEHVIKS